MRTILEQKLRKIMEDYNIGMILFIHPDLGTVQLTKEKTWYIHGRKYRKEESNKAIKASKIWCTECDVELKENGIALDCPKDGIFYECPKCNYRIVILKKGV